MSFTNIFSKNILSDLDQKLNSSNDVKISFDDILIDYINNKEIKWDANIPCGGEGSNKGFLGTLRSYLHYQNPKFWALFFISIAVLLLFPTIYKLYTQKYTNNNWDKNLGNNLIHKLAVSPEDLSLILINITFFGFVSIAIFYFVMSKDVSRIVDSNLQLYLASIKQNPEQKQKVIEAINKKIKDNQTAFDNYEKWKNKCNKMYINRTFVYIAVIILILLLFIVIQKTMFKHYSFQFDTTFILSAILIIFVFTTELYMVNFVFTKIIIVGEIEGIYNFLTKISQKLQN